MPDGRHRRADPRRRAPKAPARDPSAAAAKPKSDSGDAGAIAIHEALVGETLAEARASLANDGVDSIAQGRAVKARAEAAWGALLARGSAGPPLSMDRPPRPPQDDFGAFWEPLARDVPQWGALEPAGRSAGLAWVRVSGPRLSAFGLSAGESALVDTRREPQPGDAVLIWTGDGRPAMVALRGRGSDGRLEARPLGPDDVDDLSATRVVGVLAARAPKR